MKLPANNSQFISWSQQLVQQPTSINNRSNFEILKLDEDAFEVLNLILTGGPKWGFRIRQLNDQRVIVSRVNKGPAERSGVKVNDEILAVNNVALWNKPRSLLINDFTQLENEQTVLQQDPHQSIPNSASLSNEQQENHQQQQQHQVTHDGSSSGLAQVQPLELSKLDFAYQLIKHSSLSNKLMLTVKRYLNPAYARASVAACNLSANTANEDDRFNMKTEDTTNWGHESKTNKYRLNGSSTLAGLHYGYKCCECYCASDNEVDKVIGILYFVHSL